MSTSAKLDVVQSLRYNYAMYSFMEKLDKINEWLGSGSINIFGRPFSGKDNQGARLAKLLNGNLIGGGEILRNSLIPDYIKECLSAGKLIPSDDYINIILPYLNQSNLSNKPLILSSVGRWHGEEDSVIKALESSNHPFKVAIYLDISNDDSRARWQKRETFKDRQERNDDSEDALSTRFDEFDNKTMPVIDYYRSLNNLIKIDGRPDRDTVTQEIIDALYEQAK